MSVQPLTPGVTLLNAVSLHEAAEREFEHVGSMGLSIPGYFLAARAIELALKTSLLLYGYSANRLASREIGHDLVRALDHASRGPDGIALSDRQREVLLWINRHYVTKDLEYLTAGAKSFPPPRELLKCFEAIYEQIAPQVDRWRLSQVEQRRRVRESTRNLGRDVP